MSQYTREEILRMIEENGGPEGLDLSGKDLSGIDLGYDAIQEELKRWQASHPGEKPLWYSPETAGINLQKANLLGANLQEANIWRANLQKADLWRANLQESFPVDANLQKADLWRANLQKANLLLANLQESYLIQANLQEANLGSANLQKADLGSANLQKADLWRANLQEANLLGANLERVDLSIVANISGVFWNNAILDRTRVKWDGLIQIGEERAVKWDEAKEAYLLLKDNFNDLGQYDYGRECYIKEREMERKAHWPPWLALTYHAKEFENIQGNSWRNRLKRLRIYLKYTDRHHVWSWSILTFFKLTSMYGQRVKNVLASGFSLIVLFAFLYPMAGVVPLPTGETVISWRSLINSLPPSLIYSVASFATLQLSAGYTVDTPQAQLLTSFEALIGIIWLAYFVYAFTNMMRSS